MSEPTEQTADRIRRVVDFKIPLIYLISGVISLGWVLISMWFSVGQLVKTVDDLQITVKAGNGQAVTFAGEIALLRYRVENLEADKRLPRQQPMTGGRQ